MGRRLPTTTGELEVCGCGGPVRVQRDRFGIPYVRADSEEDAWFGLGFCQGQDRAGQLEALVRLLRGTLAEVTGKDGLAMDRLSRRVGFARAGRAQLAVLEPEVVAQFEAYVRGINEGLRLGNTRPAHELTLLGCDATPWTAADVQSWLVMLAFVLASNWDIELVQLKVLAEDGAEALAAIDPTYPAHLPVAHPPGAAAGEAIDRLASELEVLSTWLGQGGSNAWAVAPARTSTGRAILANDPHLPPMVPSLWYLASLSCPDMHVVGASAVGAPVFAPGHNGTIAWGLTAAHADNTDLFLEQVGDDGTSVRRGDDFEACEVLREEIRVKGGATVVEEVVITPRGPIVTPAFDEVGIPGEANAISMAATWLAPRPHTGMLRAHHARTLDELRANFASCSVSSVGVVYADTNGHIGSFLGVELPRRKHSTSLVPQPGWDETRGWQEEPVPFDELPWSHDPEEGFCVTANSQPAPADWDGPFLGVDWLDGYRQRALCSALGARDDWDVDASARLQQEADSGPWPEVRDAILSVRPHDSDALTAQEILRTWAGEMGAESTAAAVFTLFTTELANRVVTARAPRARAWCLGKGFSTLVPTNLLITRRLGHLVELVRSRPAGFFDSWEDAISAALSTAVRRLRARAGADPRAWQWGTVRPMTLKHLFSEKRLLAAVFDVGPLAFGGDSSTIAQGTVNFYQPFANPVAVPVVRAVFDVGNWDGCRFALLGGQSGNPFSPHYADQIAAWQTTGIPMAWSDAAVSRRAQTTLSLLPA